MSGLRWKSALVAAASFVFLAYGIERTGIASAFANSVDHIHAQDESSLADASLRMAAGSGWMTPIVMGRIFLYKPPMLQWLSALSVKIFGISLFALRLPNLIAGSLVAALLFYWGVRMSNVWAGLTGALLLVSNSVWYTFARLCYTDVLLALFSAAAIFCIAQDPKLESRATQWGFIVFDAAAIMTKSAAGVLPLIVLGLYALIGPRDQRPAISKVLWMIAGMALLVAPWHLYQLAVHPQWFYSDYINQQFLRLGINPPVARSSEITVWFYLKRVFLTDPFLSIAAVLGIPAVIERFRAGKVDARLLTAWLAVVLACISAYQWRNFPYAVMLIAPLCLIAACHEPGRKSRVTFALVALAVVWKLAAHGPVFSLSYSASQPLAAAPLLRSYADRGRSNELILVDTDDEFYSAVLPLPKVRYCFREPDNVTLRYAPYYGDLGITVTAVTFNELARWQPMFRDRLRAWGLDSPEPIATTIVAHNDDEVTTIIRSHPDSDFYLPASLEPSARAAAQDTHAYTAASPSRFFLLAKRSAHRVPQHASMLE